jgi:Ner family transcriptional regulator
MPAGFSFSTCFGKKTASIMDKLYSSRPEDKDSPDWHPADVLAALKKRGLTLAGLSVANGYHPTAAGKALRQSWPAVEKLIADALDVLPEQIWPSRYITMAGDDASQTDE